MQSVLTTVFHSVAIFFAIALCPSVVSAQQAASPGQIAAWESQKAGLEAQQQTAWAEMRNLQSAQQKIRAQIADLVAQENFWANVNPITDAARALVGADPAELALESAARNVDVKNKLSELRALQGAFAQQEAQVAAGISNRDAQIAQLERTIAYNRNAAQGDLANERAHLQGLERQKPTSDDAGQLGWDIQNTRRRIDELERQFQGGGSASGGSSSGQSQGSYGAPTPNAGTGSPSQSGYEGGPSYGPPPSSRSSMPSYETLQRGMPPQGGMAPHGGTAPQGGMAPQAGIPPQTSGGPSSGAPGPNCHQRPDGGGWHCK